MGEAVFAEGLCFYKIVSVFIVGTLLGTLVETIFCFLKYGEIMNRGSLVYGPFNIVWGFAFVFATLVYYRYKNRGTGVIFLMGTILGGIYEYVCGWFTEKFFGTKFWDYSDFKFNIGGRTNLAYSACWGVATVVWIEGIYPMLNHGIENIPVWIGTFLCNALMVFLVADMILSVVAIKRYVMRNTEQVPEDEFWERFDERFSDEKMEKIYPHMKIC